MKIRVIGFCLTLAAVFLVSVADAATVSVSWTNPTENTDNSAIPATGPGSLTSTRVEYGSCTQTNPATFGTKAGEVTVAAPASSVSISLPPGTHCIRVFARNTYGEESAASNVAVKVIDNPVPKAPVLNPVTILTTTSVYLPPDVTVVATNGALAFVPAG